MTDDLPEVDLEAVAGMLATALAGLDPEDRAMREFAIRHGVEPDGVQLVRVDERGAAFAFGGRLLCVIAAGVLLTGDTGSGDSS